MRRAVNSSPVIRLGLALLVATVALCHGYPDVRFGKDAAAAGAGQEMDNAKEASNPPAHVAATPFEFLRPMVQSVYGAWKPVKIDIADSNPARRTRDVGQSSSTLGGSTASSYVGQILQQLMPDAASASQKHEMGEHVSEATSELHNIIGHIKSSIREGFSAGGSGSSDTSQTPTSSAEASYDDPASAASMKNLDFAKQIEQISNTYDQPPPMSDSVEKLKGSFKKMFGLLQKFDDRDEPDYQSDARQAKQSGKKKVDRAKPKKSRRRDSDDDDDYDADAPKTIIVSVPALMHPPSHYPGYVGGGGYSINPAYPINAPLYPPFPRYTPRLGYPGFPAYPSLPENPAYLDAKSAYPSVPLASSAARPSSVINGNSDYDSLSPSLPSTMSFASMATALPSISNAESYSDSDIDASSPKIASVSSQAPPVTGQSPATPYYQSPQTTNSYSAPASSLSQSLSSLPGLSESPSPNYFPTLQTSQFAKQYQPPEKLTAEDSEKFQNFMKPKEKGKLLIPRHISDKSYDSDNKKKPEESRYTDPAEPEEQVPQASSPAAYIAAIPQGYADDGLYDHRLQYHQNIGHSLYTTSGERCGCQYHSQYFNDYQPYSQSGNQELPNYYYTTPTRSDYHTGYQTAQSDPAVAASGKECAGALFDANSPYLYQAAQQGYDLTGQAMYPNVDSHRLPLEQKYAIGDSYANYRNSPAERQYIPGDSAHNGYSSVNSRVKLPSSPVKQPYGSHDSTQSASSNVRSYPKPHGSPLEDKRIPDGLSQSDYSNVNTQAKLHNSEQKFVPDVIAQGGYSNIDSQTLHNSPSEQKYTPDVTAQGGYSNIDSQKLHNSPAEQKYIPDDLTQNRYSNIDAQGKLVDSPLEQKYPLDNSAQIRYSNVDSNSKIINPSPDQKHNTDGSSAQNEYSNVDSLSKLHNLPVEQKYSGPAQYANINSQAHLPNSPLQRDYNSEASKVNDYTNTHLQSSSANVPLDNTRSSELSLPTATASSTNSNYPFKGELTPEASAHMEFFNHKAGISSQNHDSHSNTHPHQGHQVPHTPNSLVTNAQVAYQDTNSPINDNLQNQYLNAAAQISNTHLTNAQVTYQDTNSPTNGNSQNQYLNAASQNSNTQLTNAQVTYQDTNSPTNGNLQNQYLNAALQNSNTQLTNAQITYQDTNSLRNDNLQNQYLNVAAQILQNSEIAKQSQFPNDRSLNQSPNVPSQQGYIPNAHEQNSYQTNRPHGQVGNVNTGIREQYPDNNSQNRNSNVAFQASFGTGQQQTNNLPQTQSYSESNVPTLNRQTESKAQEQIAPIFAMGSKVPSLYLQKMSQQNVNQNSQFPQGLHNPRILQSSFPSSVDSSPAASCLKPSIVQSPQLGANTYSEQTGGSANAYSGGYSGGIDSSASASDISLLTAPLDSSKTPQASSSSSLGNTESSGSRTNVQSGSQNPINSPTTASLPNTSNSLPSIDPRNSAGSLNAGLSLTNSPLASPTNQQLANGKAEQNTYHDGPYIPNTSNTNSNVASSNSQPQTAYTSAYQNQLRVDTKPGDPGDDKSLGKLKNVVAGIVDAIATTCVEGQLENTKEPSEKVEYVLTGGVDASGALSINANPLNSHYHLHTGHAGSSPCAGQQQQQVLNIQPAASIQPIQQLYMSDQAQGSFLSPSSPTGINLPDISTVVSGDSGIGSQYPLELQSDQGQSSDKLVYDLMNPDQKGTFDVIEVNAKSTPLEKLKNAVLDVITSALSKTESALSEDESLLDTLGCTAAAIFEALTEVNADSPNDECPAVVFGNTASAVINSLSEGSGAKLPGNQDKDKPYALDIISDTASIIADKVVAAVALINARNQGKPIDFQPHPLPIPQNPYPILPPISNYPFPANGLPSQYPLNNQSPLQLPSHNVQLPIVIPSSLPQSNYEPPTVSNSARDLANSVSSVILQLSPQSLANLQGLAYPAQSQYTLQSTSQPQGLYLYGRRPCDRQADASSASAAQNENAAAVSIGANVQSEVTAVNSSSQKSEKTSSSTTST